MEPLPSNGLTMVDLFCGAGIGAVGFLYAGYKIIDAVDNKAYAVTTYNKNIGNHARIADVRKLRGADLLDADVYVGGFPCTPFSTAGLGRGEHDEKNGDLGYHFCRLVHEKRPRAFIVENVKGILNKKHEGFFTNLLHLFEQAGYNVEWKLINSYDYGVAQLRERVFIVGIRKDAGASYVFPAQLPESERVCLRDVIGDLPIPNGKNNHYGYGLRKDEAPFAHKIPAGGNWKDLPVEDQKAFMKGAYNSGGGRTGYLRKVDLSKPAWTITATMNQKSNAQIIDDRRFTVRECLRIQSVPDWFHFDESISLDHQYERCSGIPSLVAYRLGVALADQLTAIEQVQEQFWQVASTRSEQLSLLEDMPVQKKKTKRLPRKK